MTVLIDLGNSRLKWATLKADGTLSRQRAAAYTGWQPKDFEQALGKDLRSYASHRRRAIPEVWIASVAAPATQTMLTRVVNELTGMPPRFVESSRECAGVVNGYRDPWRLGVDRWMALLGARVISPQRTVLVADIGTALTLDVLQSDGGHAGGVIIPGADLMRQSLLHSTGGIRERAGGIHSKTIGRGRKGSPLTVSWQARNTADAIQFGTQLAVAAAIDAAYAAHRAQRPKLLLTGGGSGSVQDLLRSPGVLVPDLVLQGLACAVRDGVLRSTASRRARVPRPAR